MNLVVSADLPRTYGSARLAVSGSAADTGTTHRWDVVSSVSFVNVREKNQKRRLK